MRASAQENTRRSTRFGRTLDIRRADAQLRSACRVLARIEREKQLTEGYEIASLAIFARAIRLARAAKSLVLHGHPGAAQLILRSVWESLGQIAYLNAHLSKRRRRTQVFYWEGILDQYENVDYLRRTGGLNDRRLRAKYEDLSKQRKQILAEPEFRQRPRTRTRGNTDPRWRKVTDGLRKQSLRDLMGRIEPSAGSSDLFVIDYCYRVWGNRQAHTSLSTLGGIVQPSTGPCGRQDVSFNTRPTAPPHEIRIAMTSLWTLLSMFSVVMTLLFFGHQDQGSQKALANLNMLSRMAEARAALRRKTRKRDPVSGGSRGGR